MFRVEGLGNLKSRFSPGFQAQFHSELQNLGWWGWRGFMQSWGFRFVGETLMEFLWRCWMMTALWRAQTDYCLETWFWRYWCLMGHFYWNWCALCWQRSVSSSSVESSFSYSSMASAWRIKQKKMLTWKCWNHPKPSHSRSKTVQTASLTSKSLMEMDSSLGMQIVEL